MINSQDVIKYILDSKCTVLDAAEHFDVTKRAIQHHLEKYRNPESKDYSSKIVEALKKIQLINEMEGRIKGGQIGKRGKTITRDDIENIARLYMTGHSLKSLSEEVGIPSSTIWGWLNSLDGEIATKLRYYIANKDHSLVENISEPKGYSYVLPHESENKKR